MDPEYDRDQALSLLQAAIEEHATGKNEKTKDIYTIKVSIKYILDKNEQIPRLFADFAVTGE